MAGRFLLRIDDTDRERSTAEFDQAIRDDLDWLGLAPDQIVRQSERFDLYEREFERLKAAGRVYACYETPEELELRRKVLLGRGLPPVYERKPADAPAPEGRTPHWRFRLDHDAPIVWTDLIRGEQSFDPKLLSDPVVRREDGSWLYLLPSVIDDVDLGVTHVVRGEDHVSNSAAQIADVRGAGREAAALRARGAAGRGRRQIVEAARLLRRRASARGGRRADGPAVGARADRHVAAGRARRRRSTSSPRASTSRISAARRRISTRTRSS